MLKKLYKLLISLTIFTFAFAPASQANDYYNSMFENSVHHSLYFSVPFHSGKIKTGEAPIRIGFASNFKREKSYGNPFNFNSTKFHAPLLKLEFTGTQKAKFQMAGLNFGGINNDGLYMGQDGDDDQSSVGGNSTARIIAFGVVLVGGAFFATQSGTRTVSSTCSPTPVPNVPNC